MHSSFWRTFLASVALCCASTLTRANDPDSNLDSGLNSSQESNLEPSMILNVSAKKNRVELTAPVSSTLIDRQQIEKIPTGDQVSLPTLLEETTPGILQGGYGRVFLRQDENGIQYQIDGIELPSLPSNAIEPVFVPRYIEKIEVLSGALPAEFGDHPSGVINVTTREGTEKTEGSVELNYGTYNTFSPIGTLQGQLDDGRLKYFLSANYHRTDRGLNTPNPISETDQTQGGAQVVHDSADGNDELGRLDWVLNNDNKLILLISNREEFWQIPNYPSSFQPTDGFFSPTNVDSFGNAGGFNYTPPGTNDTQSETNDFVQLVWRRALSEHSFFQLGTYWQYFRLRFNNDPVNDLAAITLNPGSSPSSFYEDRHTQSGALKGDLTVRASDDHLVKTGFQIRGSQTSGVLSVIGTNGNPPPPTLSSTDSSPTHNFIEGVYVQDQWTISKRLVLDAGLRYDAAQVIYNDAQPKYDQLQPRVGLSYLITPGTKIHVFYGRLFNLPLFEDLHELFASLQAGQNGSFDIKPEKDNYYEIGVDQQLGDHHVASLTAYYKQAKDLLDDAQLLNTSLSQPFNWSEGYAYGLEFAVRGEISNHWSDYFNYAYGIAKGQGISGGLYTFAQNAQPTPGSWQILDHVQLHTASTGLTYTSKKFWWTTTGLFGSGLRTGPNNVTHSPSHFSFDTTLGYEFLKNDEWWNHIKLALDVTNILNNRYAIFIANGYNGSYYASGREFFGRLSKDF
jgi:outer membrane receptor protein involved in Fe transport